ncbi:MAG: aminotransferase class V-fold PLP-dependent enzyme [Clostridia bacterium]|nr:aminotransferase class V-fold PLP-dependent enzyme [Clostridia bacterium]MDD4386505.1 aminotransferase class V-fold PLP-dependent enzyme [Clostridia bacterium]
MGGNEILNVQDAFKKNYIAPLGEYVDKLEQKVKEYVHIENAVALATGTSALHLALKLLNVKKDDIVFCSTLTFSASCNPILYESAIPVFIDSTPESFNMSPKAIEKAFQKYTPKAVIVVNLYGQSADMDKIKEICDKNNVPIIEDAAESLGATYKDRMSGTIGKFGVYSFNGNKIITTSGGGMLVSDDENLIKKAKFLATQARENERHYEHKEIGYNYRMSNISAAIGVGQMDVLEERIAQKKNIFNKYQEGFKEIKDINMMPICDYGKPNYWLSIITINETSNVKPIDIILELEKENIESRPIWKPMHIQPVFKQYDFFNHNENTRSISEKIFDTGLCLPSDTKMTEEQIALVIEIVKKCFNNK